MSEIGVYNAYFVFSFGYTEMNQPLKYVLEVFSNRNNLFVVVNMRLPPAELCELFLALLEYLSDTLFVPAGLFLAVLAGEGSVGILCESLGVELIRYLPYSE